MKIIKQTYTQEPHCCMSADDQPFIEIEMFDGGGGQYAVLRAEHWALDDAADVDRLADAIKALMGG